MIHLVLHGAGEKAAGLEFERRAVELLRLHLHRCGADDVAIQLGETQATLDALLGFLAEFDHGVHQNHRHECADAHALAVHEHFARAILDAAHVNHRQLDRHSDLLRGKPDAIRGAHRLQHVVRELARAFIAVADLQTFRAEHRIAVFNDFEDHLWRMLNPIHQSERQRIIWRSLHFHPRPLVTGCQRSAIGFALPP